MSDLTRLSSGLARAPDALRTAQRRGVSKGALHVTGAIRDEIRGVTGNMRLSGVGLRGARVGARYDVRGTTNPTALIRATGPLQLVEADTAAHTIRPRRRRRTKALHFGGRFAAHASHPGTRGQRPFAKGRARTEGDVAQIVGDEIWKAMGRVMS